MQSTPSMAWPLVSPELQRSLDGTKEGVVLEALGLGKHTLSPPPISPHIFPYLPICCSVTDLHCALCLYPTSGEKRRRWAGSPPKAALP